MKRPIKLRKLYHVIKPKINFIKGKICRICSTKIIPYIRKFTRYCKKTVCAMKNSLLSPSFFFKEKKTRKKTIAIMFGVLIFMIAGIVFNFIWPFPNYVLFDVIFILILLISTFTLNYFYKNMELLCVEVTPYQPFERSNHFYLIKSESSVIYVIFPLFFILAFGIGGSIIYSSIMFTPTFIWCLIFFTVVVYFSMVAYIQYIRFAYYLHAATNNNISFNKIITPDKEELPPNLIWQVRITKISHVLRNMFFTVGALYIIAFSVFCFSKAYGVRIDGALFYALWAIIFVFIVLVFPLVTAKNIMNIRKIVAKTKTAYIHELIFEEKALSSPAIDFGDKLLSIIRNYCISIILNSSDYPIKGKLTAIYSAVAALINLGASVATILQYHGISLLALFQT